MSTLLLAQRAGTHAGLAEQLEELGYTVVGRPESPEELLTLARDAEPGLVIVDAALLEQEPWEQACQDMQGHVNTPVVLASEKAPPLQGVTELAPFGVIVTPCSTAQLQAVLEAARKRGEVFYNLREQAELEKTGREELRVTLRNTLETVDEMRLDAQEELAFQIRTELFPALDSLSGEASRRVREEHSAVLKEQLQDITRGSSQLLDQLSATEMEVCRQVASGLSTKDVAEVMNLSFDTIQTHRKNIRDKLGLKGRKISLYNFLQGQKKLN
jgi:DNA-binding NarL/FixJ family response regulator